MAQELNQRLAQINEVFARASVGDFSLDVEIPEHDDELGEFFTGVQLMIEAIREKTSELEKVNASLNKEVEKRTEELKNNLEELRVQKEKLERTNRLMVGRELKMVELKKQLVASKPESSDQAHQKTGDQG